MLSGKCVLITGGTGSFGRAFISRLVRAHPEVARIVIYSRDEMKQFEMAQSPAFADRRLRFFLGDVRDGDRLRRALEGVDIVIHAAALKQVPAAEYNPFEVIKTNVIGAQNVVDASLDQGVNRVVALSTDKAAAPINLYGASKLCSDKLFVAANNHRGSRDLRFSVVRYGNVMGSRGSVIPFFLQRRRSGVLPITDMTMTRFNITLPECVDFVLLALSSMWGGEIMVPKIPSYRIADVAKAVDPDCRTEVVGVRPGEKLHEEMITETDALNSIELEDHYRIMPSMPVWRVEDFCRDLGGRRCSAGFRYHSGENDRWLSVDELRQLIATHVPG